MQAVILLGAPGAGKGTVAEGIEGQTGFVHVSTGDMLREAVKAGKPVGQEAKSYMEKGELVPDDVIMRIVKERLGAGPEDGRYLFDGFPRTMDQARMLDDVLAEYGGQVTYVFLLEVPQDVLVDRLSGRRICRECGAVYHVRNIPPRKEGVCDLCGGELYQRPDDSAETVKNRLEVFRKQTEDLIDYYDRKDLLVRIDAAQSREQTEAEISARIKEAAPGA
jgi:adenylate kinase